MMNEKDRENKIAFELETIDTIDASYFQILRKKKPLGLKCVWLVVTLCMLGFCIYLVYLLLADYFDYPSYNKMTSSFMAKLGLPAITICSRSPLNKTAMGSARLGNSSVYDVYSQLLAKYETGGTTTDDDNIFDDLDKLGIHKLYPMNISLMYINRYAVFSKKKEDLMNSAQVRYTEYGMCLEINDESNYIQKVSGPVGGLHLVLDAKTSHYVDLVASSGFQVFLRMRGETVLNAGWGFSVRPGEHANVNLKTTSVTRLGGNHWSCTTTKSPYIPTQYTTIKECYLTNNLWYFLKEETCRCWPWFFSSRFLQDRQKFVQRVKYSTTVEESLVKYWTETVDEKYRIRIFTNETCYVLYHFNGTYISTHSEIGNATECAEKCRSVENCVAFDYNANYTKTTEFGDIGTCSLYDNTVLTSHSSVDGITNGLVNCTTQFEKCTVSEYQLCSNKLIAALMNESGPALCTEPCFYTDYTYTISTNQFPSKPYWDYVMVNATDYNTWADAKDNLVKISLYYETLIDNYNDQTASYEIQNFISEFGGVADLFVGLSVFLIFQVIECGCIWLYFKCFKRTEDGHVIANTENTEMGSV